MNTSLIVVAHDIRSAHNVGSLMRTCEGLGVNKLFLTGYTPYPGVKRDQRLPHIIRKLEKQITKTSLGAEKSLHWEHAEDLRSILKNLEKLGYQLVALEQDFRSIELHKFKPPAKLALILGNEVTGLDTDLLKSIDIILEIPMAGQKESFNVVEAASMALYHCTYFG